MYKLRDFIADYSQLTTLQRIQLYVCFKVAILRARRQRIMRQAYMFLLWFLAINGVFIVAKVLSR
jgi:hypothetical protein